MPVEELGKTPDKGSENPCFNRHPVSVKGSITCPLYRDEMIPFANAASVSIVTNTEVVLALRKGYDDRLLAEGDEAK